MKYLSILFCLIFFALSCFAEYRPIQNNDKKRYKNEINKVIKKQVPVARKEISKLKREVETEKNPYIRTAIIEQGTDSILFEFYMELVNTTNKYTEIKSKLPATDWYGELKGIITPYLNDNNINTKEIRNLENYADKTKLQLKNKYNNQ